MSPGYIIVFLGVDFGIFDRIRHVLSEGSYYCNCHCHHN